MKISEIDISCYEQMSETPAGAILRHILNRLGISQKELSHLSGISPQHINAFIMGTRRFSIKSSFKIEEALGIEPSGFFYKCQCNFDIEQLKKQMRRCPDISKLRKTTFWDVDLDKVNWQKGKRWAILRVLEYGCKGDFDEISSFYGRESFLSELKGYKRSLKGEILRNASLFNLL